MSIKTDKDVSAIMKEGTRVDAALTAGVRDALEHHRRAGRSVVEWRDGKIVWLAPAEIKKRIQETDRKAPGTRRASPRKRHN